MSDITLLKNIIQVAFDSADFYDNAQRKVMDSGIRDVFTRMAFAKWDLVNTFSRLLTKVGETPPESGTSLGSFRQAYTDIRASLSSNHLSIYISELEETEERLIEHLEEAMGKVDDKDLRFEFEMYASQVRACHTEISDLKTAIAGITMCRDPQDALRDVQVTPTSSSVPQR